MNIAYFEKSLVTHLGAAARASFSSVGLSDTNIRQIPDSTGAVVSFVAIDTPELFDPALATEVLTAEQANARLTELFVPEYFISNDVIFNASLNAKIADGTVNLDVLDEQRSQSSQYHWLQLQGVKGIGVTQPPAPFVEVV